ncbi:MAG TPA: GAF domain-containing protein [Chloroflexota bacterium]
MNPPADESDALSSAVRALEAERGRRARAERAVALLHALVEAAASAQRAAGEAELFETIGRAVVRVGLNVHLAVYERDRDALVVRHVNLVGRLLPRIELLLGRPVIGLELPVGRVAQYGAVVHERRAVLDRDAWTWMRTAAPWMPTPAARTIARLVQVRAAIAAPMVAGGEVFGAITVWGSALGEEDVPTIELLGRLAGDALDARRRRAAEAARAEEAQRVRAELEAVMDAVPDAIQVFALDGRLVRANAPARRGIEGLLGGAPATLQALHQAAEPHRLDGSPSSPTAFERVVAGERVQELLAWREPEGRNHLTHVVLAPVRDEAGRVRAVVVVARDMGVVRQAISEPARVEGAILTARLVAHEVNTKLQIVTGYGSLLQRSLDADRRELIDHMVDAADEAGHIVARLQQIIRVAVIDAGAGPMLDLEAATEGRLGSPHREGEGTS